MLGVVRAALTLANRIYPDDAESFELALGGSDPDVEAAVDWLGGPNGLGLLHYARETEQRILGLLNALLTSDLDPNVEGHAELLSLRVLSGCALCVEGVQLEVQPLIMFDDGHALDDVQRTVLLDQLGRRQPTLGRWYSERFEALSYQELLQGIGPDGRDHVTVNLDDVARLGNGRKFHQGRHNPILSDIAVRRAAPVLATYAQEDQELFALFDSPNSVSVSEDVGQVVRERAVALAGGDARYSQWMASAKALSGRPAALKWREIEVMIMRDRHREQELFAQELTETDLGVRSNPAVREGAEVSLANEFGLPFYAGKNRILALGFTQR